MKIIIDIDKKTIEIIEDDNIYEREWIYPEYTPPTWTYPDWKYPVITC